MTKNKQKRGARPTTQRWVPRAPTDVLSPQRISARRHQPNKHGEKPRTLWQEGKNLQETRRDSQGSKGLEGGDQTTVPDRQKKERWEQTAEAESGTHQPRTTSSGPQARTLELTSRKRKRCWYLSEGTGTRPGNMMTKDTGPKRKTHQTGVHRKDRYQSKADRTGQDTGRTGTEAESLVPVGTPG